MKITKRFPDGKARLGILLCGVLSALIVFAAAGGRRAAAQAGAPAAAPRIRLDAATRKAVAEKYAQLLSDDYVYPEQGARMAAAIRAKLEAGAYDAITSPLAFASALSADARAVVNDPHLRVKFSLQPAPGGGPGRIRVRRTGPGRIIRRRHGGRPSRRMIVQAGPQNGGIREVKILGGNIGYLALNWMAPQDEPSRKAIAGAFALLHNTDALIIDLRGNPGGMGGAELFMSYLSQGPPFVTAVAHWREGDQTRTQIFKTTDLGKLSYGGKKPVFVLTSHRTFSAAEGLAYTIQSFKRGIVVGETTGGGANPSQMGFLPLGHGFSAFIPTGYVLNPITKTNWEGAGVKPNVSVPADEALGKAWSLAAGILRKNATNPRAGDLLDALSRAKLAGTRSIPAPRLVGVYVSVHGGPRANIAERNGSLDYTQRFPSKARLRLVWRGGDRYRLDGGFSMTFFRKDGKVELLEIMPQPMESFVLEKE